MVVLQGWHASIEKPKHLSKQHMQQVDAKWQGVGCDNSACIDLENHEMVAKRFRKIKAFLTSSGQLDSCNPILVAFLALMDLRGNILGCCYSFPRMAWVRKPWAPEQVCFLECSCWLLNRYLLLRAGLDWRTLPWGPECSVDILLVLSMNGIVTRVLVLEFSVVLSLQSIFRFQ